MRAAAPESKGLQSAPGAGGQRSVTGRKPHQRSAALRPPLRIHVHGCRRWSTEERLSLVAKSKQLTSAVRIPTTPLRPASSGAFGHEVASSFPCSRKRAAVAHRRSCVGAHARTRRAPTRRRITRPKSHRGGRTTRTPSSAVASFPFWAELKGVVQSAEDRLLTNMYHYR